MKLNFTIDSLVNEIVLHDILAVKVLYNFRALVELNCKLIEAVNLHKHLTALHNLCCISTDCTQQSGPSPWPVITTSWQPHIQKNHLPFTACLFLACLSLHQLLGQFIMQPKTNSRVTMAHATNGIPLLVNGCGRLSSGQNTQPIYCRSLQQLVRQTGGKLVQPTYNLVID